MSQYSSILIPCHQYWGRKTYSSEKTDDFIGVEFENETNEPFVAPTITGWTYHEEASLRNFGFEYVLRTPKSKQKLQKAISLYFERMRESLGSLDRLLNSRRTSTHIHFDVGQWNFVEIMTATCLYWVLEPLLVEFCGENRRGNHFCLGAKDSIGNVLSLARNIKDGNPWSSIAFSNDFRYASVNLASIAKFSSLEFRLMRGLSDEKTFWTWLNILDAIRLYSFKFSSPKDLSNKFLNEYSADQLPRLVFGEELFGQIKDTLPKNFNIAEEIRDVFINLSPLMLAHPDWKFEKEIKEEEERKTKWQNQIQSVGNPWQELTGITATTLGVNTPSPFNVYDDIWEQPTQPLAVEDFPVSTYDEDFFPDLSDDDDAPYIPDELSEDF